VQLLETSGFHYMASLVMLLLIQVPSLPRAEMSRSPVSVSVARNVFQGGVASPTPNPPPFSAGLGTVLDGV
jgi:hypothetical protein